MALMVLLKDYFISFNFFNKKFLFTEVQHNILWLNIVILLQYNFIKM